MGDLMLLSAGFTPESLERMGAAYRGTALTILQEREVMRADAIQAQQKEMDARLRHGG